MYAYKEIITLDNPQQLNLSKPLPFLKGKKVEVLVIIEDDDDENEFYIDKNACLQALDKIKQGNRSGIAEIENVDDYIKNLKDEIN